MTPAIGIAFIVGTVVLFTAMSLALEALDRVRERRIVQRRLRMIKRL